MQQSVTFEITIHPPITVDPITGVVGQALPAAVAHGGSGAPYVYSGATGLPAGVSMNANGSFTGDPTTAGTYTVTVTVADSQG